MEVIPARRNNIDGATRPEGDQWGAGFLEGEDSCGDTDDFAIDFDNRGKDGDGNDGTDWGEDDMVERCGRRFVGDAQWFIFVRESRPPACGNGRRDVGEACDDGNLEALDGCSPECIIECGNGVVEGDEACDDGNRIAFDGCSPTCVVEIPECGNG
ncbi:MAG: DUF4215 domain-containing protein, partial [Myxococcales bacterium]|nr:DUF4215 domain-containing protein [Myxococcales bacterium]